MDLRSFGEAETCNENRGPETEIIPGSGSPERTSQVRENVNHSKKRKTSRDQGGFPEGQKGLPGSPPVRRTRVGRRRLVM